MIVAVIIILIIAFFSYSLVPTFVCRLQNAWRRKPQGKKIFLTFDDGPSEYTEELLAVLKKYHIRASFFCVASFAKKYPELIKKMNKENHVIGLHSLQHQNAFFMGRATTKKDFQESISIMNEVKQEIHYYRPPWGMVNLFSFRELRRYQLSMILWNVMAEDWRGDTTASVIERKLLKRIKAHDVICLHDGRGKNQAPKRTIEALTKVIPVLLSQGYVFETVDHYE